MTVEIEVVGSAGVSGAGDPGLENAGAEPDVEVVLFRIASGSGEAVGVAFHERNEIRRAHAADETQQRPAAVAPGLVAELGIQQVACAIPDAIAAWIGP